MQDENPALSTARIQAVSWASQVPACSDASGDLLKRADNTSLEKPTPLVWQLSGTSIPGTTRRNHCPKPRHPQACVQTPQSIPSKDAQWTFPIQRCSTSSTKTLLSVWRMGGRETYSWSSQDKIRDLFFSPKVGFVQHLGAIPFHVGPSGLTQAPNPNI